MIIFLEIDMKPEGGILRLPIHYNHMVQAALYHSIDDELATFLHEQGYTAGNRAFRLFAFSQLKGNYRFYREQGHIVFDDEVKLILASPLNEFCESLVNTLLTRGNLRLGQSELAINKVFCKTVTVDQEPIIVRTLSPVVTYSTLLRPDGRKYTCYFQPGERDFDALIENNLRKKHEAFYGEKAREGNVEVKPLGRQKLNVIQYKGTVIKGYSGKLRLSGPVELLQMALDAGLGSKNAQGFGCLEWVKEEKR